MKPKSKILLIVVLLTSSLPLAKAITINGPYNFQGPHGGNVRFGSATVSSRVNIVNALIHLNGLTFGGGINRGALGFDAQTGVNMTILAVNRYTIIYNVSTAIANPVNTYVHYSRNDNVPTGTNTDNINYNPGTDIATVTTTGDGVIVTLNYATASSLAIENYNTFLAFLPVMFIVLSLEMKKRDLINNKLFIYMMIVAAGAFIVIAMRAAGL
jgi:hypothetical protein